MAAEAEAGRAARAKVIAADGEMRASKALSEASGVIEKSPAAIQLRHLQVDVKIFNHWSLQSKQVVKVYDASSCIAKA